MVTAVGDEGGFAPNLKSNREALDLLVQAIEKAGYTPGQADRPRARRGRQRAGGEEDEGKVRYALAGEGRTGLASSDLIALYREWLDAYPLVSIEDGLAEDDWDGWKEMTAELGGRVQIVGDDLFVTNPEILARGIAEGLANALLVKVNQIGTLTETLEAVEMAKTHAYANILQPPLGGDRGHHHRRSRGRHPRAGRSRPAPPAAATASPSTTASCASKRSWRAWPPTPGPRPSPAGHRDPPEAPVRTDSFRPVLGATVLLVLALLAIAALKSYRDLEAARARERLLETKIAATRAESERLRVRIDRLRHDPGMLERLAREDLGMVRPGDVIVELPDARRGRRARRLRRPASARAGSALQPSSQRLASAGPPAPPPAPALPPAPAAHRARVTLSAGGVMRVVTITITTTAAKTGGEITR